MTHQTIVGLYPTRILADEVCSSLRTAGISDNDISLGGGASPEGQIAAKPEGGFWDWLFGSEVSDTDRERYSGHLRNGRIAVSVRARSEADHDTIVGVLDRFDPIEIEGDDASTASTSSAAASSDTGAPVSGSAAFAAAERRGAARRDGADGDRVIGLAKEELEVGKRQVERRFRVRTHVIETPVEETVHLRDERVVIERRPASGTATAGAASFQNREFDVIERHEEAVVGKRVAAVEEVVIRKDRTDRVETVKGTVRETKLDIDKAAAGDKPSPVQTSRDSGVA